MERYFEYLDNELYSHHTLDAPPDPAKFAMHVHEQMELFYLVSGSGEYLVEGTHYELRPHTVLIARSAETHRLLLTPEKPYERISILFNANLIRNIDPEGYLLHAFLDRPLGMHNCYYPGSPANLAIQRFFRDFDFNGSNAQKRLHIIRVLLGSLSEIALEFNTKSEGKYSGKNNIAQDVIHYVNMELFNKLSLEEISKKFYLSESHINRIFKDATGVSLWTYIRTKRLLAAREKIQAGESASSACSTCGFQDYSAFFRAYKQRFGVSPTETRSNQIVHTDGEIFG